LYERYQPYYRIYRQLYENTKEEMHTLAQLRAGRAPASALASDSLVLQLA
jgi:hypothetical protein